MTTERGAYCANCRMVKPQAELLAYWEVDQPDLVRYVCRPASESQCFRMRVGIASVHAIGPAATGTPALLVPRGGPMTQTSPELETS